MDPPPDGAWKESFALYLSTQQGYAQGTIKGSVNSAAYFLRHAPGLGIDPTTATHDDLCRYFAWHSQRTAPGTPQRYLYPIRYWYAWQIGLGLRSDDPTQGIRLQGRKRTPKEPFTLDELRRLLVACTETDHPLRDRAIILMLIGSGVRRSEMIGMRLSDVDWDAGLIAIRHPKGRHARRVAPGDAAMAALEAYVFAYRPQVALWLNFVGSALTIWGFDLLLRRLGLRAQLRRVHAHRFRTTFACLLLEETGGDVQAIQVGMGHQRTAQTLEYGAWVGERRALAVMRQHSLADRIAG